MGTLWQDVKYGARLLARSPSFTAVAVLTLVLGIGANTAIFSVIDSVLLRPLPFPDPGQLVELWESEPAPGNYPLTGPDYLDWAAQNRTLAGTSLFTWGRSFNASGAGQPEAATVVNVQANFFSILDVQPLLGRTFAAGEDRAGKNQVAVVSYGFWQAHFGGEAAAIGKTLELNGRQYSVIGIMPRWFNFPAETDLWFPLDMNPEELGGRGTHQWRSIARMKPGITAPQAAADLTAIEQRLGRIYPNNDANVRVIVIPLKQELTRGWRDQLVVLLGAVMLVLLVACANLANLTLARASARQREFAVRAALGAGRWRLATQLLTESVTLALGAAALGLVGASWAVEYVRNLKSLSIPRANPIQMDWRVLLFTTGLAVATGILFGLAPAIHASHAELSGELKSSAQAVVGGSAGRSTLRDALVVAEIALSLALLVGAGLMLRSFAKMRRADIGVRANRVLTMTIVLPSAKYAAPAVRRAFFHQLLARIQATPGVDAAALSSEIPLEGGMNGYIQVPGNANPAMYSQLVEWDFVTPDYFRAYGVPLLEGRNLTPDDARRAAEASAKIEALYDAAKGGQPRIPPDLTLTAVINRAMAQTFWPHQSPVGQAFTGGPGRVRVIGVVGDVKEQSIRGAAYPQAYFPYSAAPGRLDTWHITVRTTGEVPASVLGSVRGDLRGADGSLAAFRPRTMKEVIAGKMQDTSLETFLLGVFAGIAVLLAALGIYGVMAGQVAQRIHEIGIRMALGAQRKDALGLILAHGAKLTIAGVAIGMGAAFGLTRLIAAELFGVTATDPATYAAVAALLLAVALLACYLPARRATRVDPAVALREE